MSARKTEEQKTASRAAGAAKRYNREQAEKAPLLAWAGLTPTTTAEAVQERQHEAHTHRFWTGVRHAEAEAAKHFGADWYRWVVWSLVEPDVFERVAAWADRPRWGGAMMRRHYWKAAAALASEGLDPLPAVAVVHPSACWAALAKGLAEGRWEKAAHEAAGCTPERCNIALCDRPAPLVLGSAA